MTLTPLTQYEHDVMAGRVHVDPEQRRAIEKLEQIFELLTSSKKIWLKRRQPIQGMYLWGSVGIGKTYLMDLFYDCVMAPKMRQHFFNFMLMIHQKLREKQGQKNPLQRIAEEIAAQTRVICFDEFFVHDIADAMLLGELLKSLFANKVVLIATSNCPPDDLYKNGLQRERFLPAITALKAHTDVVHLTTQHDYRTQASKPICGEQCKCNQSYFFPLNESTQKNMQQAFDFYNGQQPCHHEALHINQHILPVLCKGPHVLWCRFHDLCEDYRSDHDYILLAQQFHTILIDDVTPLSDHERKTIRRFIHLIDILYDTKRCVVMRASVCAHDLYRGTAQFEFERTLSRLIEMQSTAYTLKIKRK